MRKSLGGEGPSGILLKLPWFGRRESKPTSPREETRVFSLRHCRRCQTKWDSMFFSTKVLLVVLSLCTRGGLSSNFFRSGKMGTKLRVRRPAPAKHEQVISRADLISEITVPANTCKVDSNSSVAIFVRMYEGHRLARFCTLQSERKICDLWPAKNMWFWSGKKYVLLVWRKICTLGPTKNM